MNEIYLSSTKNLSNYDIETAIDKLLQQYDSLRKILIIPPDFTRCFSKAGDITQIIYKKLSTNVKIDIMPALGTHAMINDEERIKMYGDIPKANFLHHKWQSDTIKIGEVPKDFVAKISNNLFNDTIDVEVNKYFWDFRQGIPSVGLGLSGHADGGLYQVGPLVVEGRGHDDILHQRHRVARLDVGSQAEAGHLALLDADGVVDGFLVVLVEVIGQGETDLRVFPSGLCPQVGAILADARINHIPYLFFRIFGVVVQVGLEQGEQRQAAGIVERGDAIADEAEVGVGHVDQMLDMHLQAVAARRSGLDIAVGDAVVHVEPAVEAVHVP